MRRFKFDIPATLVAEEHPDGPWVMAEEALHAVEAVKGRLREYGECCRRDATQRERDRCRRIVMDIIDRRCVMAVEAMRKEWISSVEFALSSGYYENHRTLQEAEAQETDVVNS